MNINYWRHFAARRKQNQLTTSVDAEAVAAEGPHHLPPPTVTVVVPAPVAAEWASASIWLRTPTFPAFLSLTHHHCSTTRSQISLHRDRVRLIRWYEIFNVCQYRSNDSFTRKAQAVTFRNSFHRTEEFLWRFLQLRSVKYFIHKHSFSLSLSSLTLPAIIIRISLYFTLN
jgi:hypothetical protein